MSTFFRPDPAPSPRERIDNIDVRIGALLKEHQHALTLDNTSTITEIPDNVACEMSPAFAPAELIFAVAKFIDVSQLEPEQADHLFSNLAIALAERYLAVVDVAKKKREEGAKTSYVPERHQEVLDNYENFGGGDTQLRTIFRAIGESIAGRMVEYQDRFLQIGSGPIGETIYYQDIRCHTPLRTLNEHPFVTLR